MATCNPSISIDDRILSFERHRICPAIDPVRGRCECLTSSSTLSSTAALWLLAGFKTCTTTTPSTQTRTTNLSHDIFSEKDSAGPTKGSLETPGHHCPFDIINAGEFVFGSHSGSVLYFLSYATLPIPDRTSLFTCNRRSSNRTRSSAAC